jgi:hypothetical protein
VPTDTITIRSAVAADSAALRRLAELDSRRPLRGSVLIAEVGGVAVAARSVDDGRTAADPFVATAEAVAMLNVRARAIAGVELAPTLRGRIAAALPSWGRDLIYQN